MEYRVEDLPQRMARKIAIDAESGCWVWNACLTSSGYGHVGVDGKLVHVHRFSYEYFVGPIPPGLEIDHVKKRGCTSRACCNPAHLEPVTHAENVRRGDVGMRHRDKTHCPAGHPYSGENIYVARDGRRACRVCRRSAVRRWRALNRDVVNKERRARRRALKDLRQN